MAAPIGNRNYLKNKPWAEAIRIELAQYEDDSIKAGHALRAIAKTVIMKALAGDKDAVTEIGNRTDGKAVQGVELSGPDGAPMELLSKPVNHAKVIADAKKRATK